MSTDLAIDVRGLTKAFAGRTVVDHIDLAVPRGQVCGFLGPNGSGKTTTIRMLCGLLEVDAGEGTCLGYDIRREARRIKLRVGYMTQRFGLYEDLSIGENLDFTARIYRLDNRKRRVAAALDRLGLTARKAQLAGTLSGGWKQRLALAALGVEVGRVEPGFEGRLQRRPFAVDGSVPCAVAVAALVHDRLPEDAFEAEAQALRRPTRARVQRVALPLVAPISQFVESPAHH